MLTPTPLLAICCCMTVLATSPALADLSARFVEGAPKDRFEIRNTGSCDIAAATVRLDLSTSQGQLIFDVTGSGAGVEVFQPFDVVEGRAALATLPVVTDGQNMLDLNISKLEPGSAIAFTIDVDDTLGAREITVTGSEISGGTVHLTHGGTSGSAEFTSAAKAELSIARC